MPVAGKLYVVGAGNAPLTPRDPFVVRKPDSPGTLPALVRATLSSVRLAELSDGELLVRFVATRDNEPFAELVRRLGPTVLGVCRRLLGTGPDAEDAFQVAFMVLARRAGSVRPPGRVAAWLHGVALLTARKVRHVRNRRAARESTSDTPIERTEPCREWEPDLAEVLDAELDRLPAKYRLPVVLCEVRELTVAQAATELGWPVGTVASRLSRGRAALANRLRRRGVTVGSTLFAAGGTWAATAQVPAHFIGAAVRAADTGGTVFSAVILPLLSEVLRAMTLSQVRMVGAWVLVAATVLGGFGLLRTTDGAAPSPENSAVAKTVPLNRAIDEDNDRRAAAELVLTIQVVSVKEVVHGANKDVTVTAKVLGVEKSAFGTRKGEELIIAYTDSVKPIPGFESMPTLEKDGVYPAFLNRNDKEYQPAAWAASFRMAPGGGRVKESKNAAERFGAAMRTIDTFLKARPADPKRDELQQAVIAIGQSGEHNGYVWAHARLGWECGFLEARKAELGNNLTKEQVKEIDDQVAYLKRTQILIDAPK